MSQGSLGFESLDDNFETDPAFVARRSRAQEMDRASKQRVLRYQVAQLGKQPLQSIFSSLLMLYFSGSHLSLMSLMLCFMLLSGPLKGFLSFRESFAPFEEELKGDAALARAKVTFLFIHGAVFCVAAWKTWQLGILPITAADFTRYRWGMSKLFVVCGI